MRKIVNPIHSPCKDIIAYFEKFVKIDIQQLCDNIGRYSITL